MVVEITAYAEKIEPIPVAILTGSGTVTPHTFGAVGATDSTVGKAEAPEIPEANDLTNSRCGDDDALGLVVSVIVLLFQVSGL